MSRIPALDSLRGIAVLLVLLSHASICNMNILPGLDLSYTGKYGVYLFFVLSAYLLDKQIIVAVFERKDKFFQSYLVKRFMRIYPLYIISLIIMYIINSVTSGYRAIEIVDFNDIIKHIFLLESKSIYWSIPVEFLYYLVSPFLVLIIKLIYSLTKNHSFVFLFLGTLISCSILGWYVDKENIFRIILFTKPVKYFTLFIPGLTIAYIHYFNQKEGLFTINYKINKILLIPCIILLAISIRLIWTKWLDLPFIWHDMRLAIVFGCIWSIILSFTLFKSCKNPNFLRSTPLMLVGKVSYSAYLLHIPILYFYRDITEINPHIKLLLFLATTTAISYLSYRLLENQFSKITKKILK